MSKGYMPKRPHESLYEAHDKEVKRKKAEFYNAGWAQGADFIHSKTSKGRLLTTRKHVKGGGYTHQWDGDDD